MKRTILFLILLNTFLATEAVEWRTDAPGKALENQEIPQGTRRIIFDPAKAAPGEYWCSTRLNFKPASAARKVTFAIRAKRPGKAAFKVTTGNGRALHRNIDVYTEWSRVTLDFSKEAETLSTFEIIFHSNWPAASLELRDLKFQKNKVRPEMARFWMPECIPAPVPGYRIETTIHSCWRNNDNEFPGIATPEGREMALDITRKLKQEYGDLSVAVNFFGGVTQDEATEFVRKMNEMDVIVLSEGHDNPPPEYVKEHSLEARNINGETYPDASNTADKTNPKYLEYLQKRLEFSAKSGASVYRSVDYTWQHHGGPIWGYSDAAIRRWVEDLEGTDGRLEVSNGKDGRAHVGFRDYFKSYYGYFMKPEDCGITSWAEYRPPAAGEPDSPTRRNRQKLFVALYHYEWVKFLNESVRPYEHLGMRAQPTLNPESQYNGTDLYWMLKSSLTRGWCTEWWNTAQVIVPVYYHSRYYGNVANKFILDKNGLEYELYSEIKPNPTIDNVKHGVCLLYTSFGGVKDVCYSIFILISCDNRNLIHDAQDI